MTDKGRPILRIVSPSTATDKEQHAKVDEGSSPVNLDQAAISNLVDDFYKTLGKSDDGRNWADMHMEENVHGLSKILQKHGLTLEQAIASNIIEVANTWAYKLTDYAKGLHSIAARARQQFSEN